VIVIEKPDDLLSRTGTHLGWSDWHTITQADIDGFAAASGNQAPIHTDPEFAATTPYGGTIAFGIQVLSMATMLMSDVWELRVSGGVDVGSNRVRHLAPVLAGGRVRVGLELAEAEPLDNGVRATLDLTFEVEGSERPACVAQIVFIYYF
jgi:acyl dehydratase